MRRDVLSAYLASGTRAGAWAAVTGLAAYRGGVEALAVMALVRATIGVLNYAALGLAPAMVRSLSIAARGHPTSDASFELASVYRHGLILGAVAGTVGLLIVLLYAWQFGRVHDLPAGVPLPDIRLLVLGIGGGLMLRLCSEVPAAVLQVRGRIGVDYLLAAGAELVWAVASFILVGAGVRLLPGVGMAFAVSGSLLLVARLTLTWSAGRTAIFSFQWAVLRILLTYGGLITVAQLADYLYTPTDYILINRYVSPAAGGVYAPAVQIDGALHLIALGIAGVLLPKAAVAYARGDLAAVRRWYVRGTLASVGLTLPAALFFWLLSPQLFTLWLHDPMPQTQKILPLVLLHNLIGGSGTVGRSILLALGKAKPYSVSVLAAGLTNVAVSFALVRYGGLGLYGIILGTLLAVGCRALVWQPWYVTRCLRRADERALAGATVADVAT